jgi:uncharacterized membrane protein
MSEIPPPTVPPATPPPPGGGSYTPPPPPPPTGGGYGAPPPAGGTPSGDRTLWIILSYLGILSLIPYLSKKDDPDQEIRWHAKNGLALFLAELAICIVLFVLSLVLSRIPGLGCVTWVIQCILPIAFLAISIICIIKGVNGQRYRIPMITDFAEKSL